MIAGYHENETFRKRFFKAEEFENAAILSSCRPKTF